jgi:hypothetical protein
MQEEGAALVVELDRRAVPEPSRARLEQLEAIAADEALSTEHRAAANRAASALRELLACNEEVIGMRTIEQLCYPLEPDDEVEVERDDDEVASGDDEETT